MSRPIQVIIEDRVETSETLKNLVKIEDVKRLIPDRIKNSHKGTYGRVALLGGAVEYSGAIRLSAMALAALKSGAGLSTVAVPRFLVPIVSENILEVMIYSIESNDREIIFDKENVDGLLNKEDVLTCGMGLGKSKGAHEIIYYIVKNFDKKLILDADALNIISEDITVLKSIKNKTILTPHMMEFKRLYDAAFNENISIDELERDKDTYVKKFTDRYDVTLLLKGPETLIVNKEKGISVVDRGTPGMATAGSGDVLSGIITGFSGYIDDEYSVAIVSAFVNGMAGELAAKSEGEISMTSSDTVRNIAEAVKIIKG